MSAIAADRPVIAEWRASGHLVGLTLFALCYGPVFIAPYAMGMLVAPLEQAFGWSRASIQIALMFSGGLALIGSPLAGWMISRIGIRRTILSGVVGLAASTAACTLLAGPLWQLYLLYGCMSILGAGAGAVAWNTLIAGRFHKSRGLALGVALSGSGVAAIVIPWVTALGLQQGGWRGAYLTLAGYGMLCVLPACALLLPRSGGVVRAAGGGAEAEPAQPGMTAAAVARGYRFWLLGISTMLVYFGFGGLVPNLVPALTDGGLSRPEALTIMSFYGMSIIAGRVAIGFVIDHVWAPLVAACILLPAAVACLSLQLDLTFALYALAVVVMGFANGMEFDMLGFLAARYFGLADFPRIYGRLYMFVAFGSAISAPVYGSVYDSTGNYGLAFTGAAVLMVVGAIGLLAMGRYPQND